MRRFLHALTKKSLRGYSQLWLIILLFWIGILALSWIQFKKQPAPQPSEQLTTTSAVSQSTSSYNNVRVVKVIDGDTFEIETGEHVRLIGVDTPESRNNQKARRDSARTHKDIQTIIQMGLKAKEILRGLIENKQVSLEFDVGQKDKYGRLLAYVYMDAAEGNVSSHAVVLGDRVFINATLVKLGYASPMTIPPNVKYAREFKSLFEEARVEKNGLWEGNQLAFE